MATVELVDVRKVYRGTEAVRGVSLRIEEGEFFSLLGPSGCGKTTTLRMVAGFVQPTAGEILIGGQRVTSLPPEKREIGIVFQNYAIFPHMSVFDNVSYGLKVRKVSKTEIHERVTSVLTTVGLAGYEKRYQRELSGGEQQRVALARVLVIRPRILLLDEPLSALDKKLREEMKYWIKGLQQELRITTIYVTHDQGEALTMSDRIAVMNKGLVDQIDSPKDLYERPRSRFVTDFIGHSNILSGLAMGGSDEVTEIAFGASTLRAPKLREVQPGQNIHFAFRPENVRLGFSGNGEAWNHLSGRVESQSYQGALIRYEVKVGEEIIVAEVQNTTDAPALQPSAEVSLSWPVTSTSLLVD